MRLRLSWFSTGILVAACALGVRIAGPLGLGAAPAVLWFVAVAACARRRISPALAIAAFALAAGYACAAQAIIGDDPEELGYVDHRGRSQLAASCALVGAAGALARLIEALRAQRAG